MSTTPNNPPAFPTPSGFAKITAHQPGVGEFETTVEVCKTVMTPTDQGIHPSARLDSATLAQLTWKPGTARAVAVAIVQHALNGPDVIWPDQVDYSATGMTPDDKNCVGLAFRNLQRNGIIQHGSSFRRSQAQGANSRTIFSYTLASRSRAELFLKRNGAGNGKPVQGELIV